MSYISGARSVPDEQVRIASTKMDGIGPKKAIQVRYRLVHFFFFRRVRSGGKKEICCFLSAQANTPASTVRLPRKRCGRTRGQSNLSNLGYRAVSAVGVTEDVLVRFLVGYDILVDCWERPRYSKYAFLGALRSAAQMVPYEVSIGLILIVRLVSTFGSAKAIARMFP
ncbi:hypothetical protein M5K25_028216 [Dendrobium thyrsiflorum]|uniref:Uncharacterized protein n=1 Tax=Dendrobium thyrsiflorum TaxID=117978 RepID=A0ABD0TTV5_DENTH